MYEQLPVSDPVMQRCFITGVASYKISDIAALLTMATDWLPMSAPIPRGDRPPMGVPTG